ncbi:hypothetical protein [Rubrivirga sp.]|uniref:hypothetical protein n=1 Tax=Rubrivirga sp. TaxID=1885344 RepID=UPI003C7477A7
MHVVYLDPYFLGDPLFAPGLARDLATRSDGVLLVHGSGERGERALESLGRMPTSKEGIWVTDDLEGRDAVERATRELNRELHHELNEAGVATIRVTGGDRGLLKQRGDDLEVGKTGWVSTALGQGVTVVLASLVEVAGDVLEVDAATAAGALGEALGLEVVALSKRALETGDLEAEGRAFPDLDAVRRLRRPNRKVVGGPRSLLRSSPSGSFAELCSFEG